MLCRSLTVPETDYRGCTDRVSVQGKHFAGMVASEEQKDEQVRNVSWIDINTTFYIVPFYTVPSDQPTTWVRLVGGRQPLSFTTRIRPLSASIHKQDQTTTSKVSNHDRSSPLFH